MLFYSNVFSLIDWSINGVNPCTLMYIQNIKLAHVFANDLQGPNFELYIRFNQFNNKDYGFGTGWELSLSRVDEENDTEGNVVKTLVLSDGSRYRIDKEDDTTVTLKYKKANTFKVLKENDQYTVVYKNGLMETIEDGQVVTITGANGKTLDITWAENGAFTMIDDDGIIALSAEVVEPVAGTGEEKLQVKTSRGTFSYAMTRWDSELRQLDSVTVAEGESERVVYKVGYEIHNTNYLAITSFSAWLEYKTIAYISYGMLSTPTGFSGDALAVVSTRTYLNGKPKNEIYQECTYGFTEGNYLGSGAVSKWNDSTDNLEGLPASTVFSSAETVGQNDKATELARKTIWTYNKFYLLTTLDWEPKSAQRSKSECYDYTLALDNGIDAQCAYFMLPVKKTERVTVKPGNAAAQDIDWIYSFEYDDYANVTRQAGPDGLVENFLYYDGGAGEDGSCPPDPNGFVNYVKSRTIMPSQPDDGAKTKTWNYTYKLITGTDLVLVTQEAFSAQQAVNPVPSAVVLCKKDYSYEETDPAFVGQLRSVISGKAVQEKDATGTETTRYLNTKTDFQDSMTTYKSKKTWKRIQTITGFDGQKISSSLFLDGVTGDIVCVEDENGVTVDYTYDSLGRETGSVREASQDGEISETTIYSPAVNEKTITSSTNKFSEIYTYDGLGNIVKEEISFMVGDGKKLLIRREMAATQYNNLGQQIKNTLYDYLLEERSGAILKKYVKEVSCEWNIYDEIVKEIHADNSVDRYQYDMAVTDAFRRTLAVDHDPGSVRKTSFYDKYGLLVQRQTCSPVDAAHADITERFAYDKFLRMISSSETGRELVRYAYDDFDRKIMQAGLESGSQATEYAAHSMENLVARISIDGVVVGEKGHDGLGREISTTTAGVTTLYRYANSAVYTRPSSQSVEGGRYTEYEYDALFDKIISRKVRLDKRGASWMALREFTYDSVTGRLLSAKNTSQGRESGQPYFEFSQQYTYNLFGVLTEESGGCTLPSRNTYSHAHTLTLRGLREGSVIKPAPSVTFSRFNGFNSRGQLTSARFLYNNTVLSSSVISRNQYGDIGMIEHESYLYSNQPPVGNLKPLIHKRYYHARYNTVSEVSFSHQYVLGMSSRKIKKQDQILTCQFEYDVHHLLTRLKNKFSATSTFNWSERYRYTRLGQLQSWSRHGDMVFFDEYGNKMSGQKFVMDKMGNMQKLTAEIEGVSNESTYSYTNNFRLLRIDNKNAWAKLMVPKMINFTYSAEGQLVTKRYTIGETSMVDNYSYAGEDNVIQVLQAIAPDDEEHLRNYFYDAHGNVARSLQTEKAGTLELLNYYAGNDIFFSANTADTSPENSGYTLYHRLEEEVVFITHIDAKGEIQVCPCLGLPNGNQIARGRPSLSYRYDRPYKGKHTFNVRYLFNISGQNAYGMSFDLAANIPFQMKGL